MKTKSGGDLTRRTQGRLRANVNAALEWALAGHDCEPPIRDMPQLEAKILAGITIRANASLVACVRALRRAATIEASYLPGYHGRPE
jgi:hypothetical protein